MAEVRHSVGLRDGEKLPREREARETLCLRDNAKRGTAPPIAPNSQKKSQRLASANVYILRNPSTPLQTASIASFVHGNFMLSHKHISQFFLALTTAFIC
jgi:hypothetical protein